FVEGNHCPAIFGRSARHAFLLKKIPKNPVPTKTQSLECGLWCVVNIFPVREEFGRSKKALTLPPIAVSASPPVLFHHLRQKCITTYAPLFMYVCMHVCMYVCMYVRGEISFEYKFAF